MVVDCRASGATSAVGSADSVTAITCTRRTIITHPLSECQLNDQWTSSSSYSPLVLCRASTAQRRRFESRLRTREKGMRVTCCIGIGQISSIKLSSGVLKDLQRKFSYVNVCTQFSGNPVQSYAHDKFWTVLHSKTSVSRYIRGRCVKVLTLCLTDKFIIVSVRKPLIS